MNDPKKCLEDIMKETISLKVEIAVLRERFERDAKTSAVALELSAKEISRRLDFLNGEAERLRIMQATYVSQEIYDTNHKYLVEKVEMLTKFLYLGLGSLLAIEFILRFIKS